MPKQDIAKVDNQFVLKSHYKLTANEQKLILYLISNIDPQKRKDFTTQEVKITEIEKAFSGGKKQWNSIYDRVDLMCKNIMESPITLPKHFVVDGKEIRMNKRIPWFVDIDPHYDEDGDIAVKFEFHSKLKDFLLQLSQYVQININDILPLRGKHSIRMYQIFKAEKQRVAQYKNVAILTYGLDELKAMLGIEGKYKDRLRNFTNRVVEPMKNEINEYSTEINIDYQYLKTRRKVTGIEFRVFDAPKGKKTAPILLPKESLKNFVPSEEDLKALTYSQYKAYHILIAFEVYGGIALREIIPTIRAGDLQGYEDLFIKSAIDHFLKTVHDPKGEQTKLAAIFVNWWTDKKVFDPNKENTVYWKLAEQVRESKKGLNAQQREARLQSIGLPHEEFVQAYNERATQESEETSEYKGKVAELAEKLKI